jgi:hypothetical protein
MMTVGRERLISTVCFSEDTVVVRFSAMVHLSGVWISE